MKISNTNKFLLSLLVGAASLQSCSSDDDSNNTTVQELNLPETITINEAGLFPEGIDFNNNTNEFLVSSFELGSVGTINAETGEYTAFVQDENFVNVAGIFTDEVRNRLLVVSGDVANGNLAYLGIYNLETGAPITDGIFLNNLLDEDSGSFGNDITVDEEGNIYVTDSFSPVIYRVDATTFEPSILVNGGDAFSAINDGPGFALNGIVYLNGDLIVNVLNQGTLFKVPVNAPEDYTLIDAPLFFGGDGLEVDADGNIVIVDNGFSAEDRGTGAYTLSSTDGFDTATISSSFLIDSTSFPTTAALASDGNIYVVNAYLTSSATLGGEGTQETFTILRAE